MIERTAKQAGRVGLGREMDRRRAARGDPGGQLRMLVQLRRETAAAAERARCEHQPPRRDALQQLGVALDDHAEPIRRGLVVEGHGERSDVGPDAAPAVLLEAALAGHARPNPDGALSGPAADTLCCSIAHERDAALADRRPSAKRSPVPPCVGLRPPLKFRVAEAELRRPKRLRHSLRCANRHTAPAPAGGLPARRR